MRFTVAAAVLATSVLAQEPVSTDYTTELVTITACPETVTNCPARQQTTSVATNYIPLTTSTVYETHVHTVTSCGPEVTNCPAHSTVLSTETVAVSTTICPVTATATAVPTTQGWSNSTAVVPPPYPTGGESSASPVTIPVYTPPAVSSPVYTPPAQAPTTGYAAPTGGAPGAPGYPVSSAAPVCPGSSVVAVTKSYTTVLTSVEYQTVAVPCPTGPAGGNPGGAPSGTGAVPPQPTGPAGNGTTVPPPVNGAASFTGSAVFAVIAGAAALFLA
ncbi:gpi anchored serine-rich [Trichoderma arundinaceum]|uniref:Gpi anchored serine-rich n=1 Tax=Trichoderma arundinaceum TaxID=490622 RepID=A0A395NBR4_TRIAR|nr:gpi anchored serine-rich [Trichoderma arundinaceum]